MSFHFAYQYILILLRNVKFPYDTIYCSRFSYEQELIRYKLFFWHFVEVLYFVGEEFYNILKINLLMAYRLAGP